MSDKHDADRARWDLLPWSAAREIVRVLQFGAAKYGDDNWRHVTDARRRYFSAAIRHLAAWWDGEKRDPESGLPHLAHAGASILFLLVIDEESRESAELSPEPEQLEPPKPPKRPGAKLSRPSVAPPARLDSPTPAAEVVEPRSGGTRLL